MGTPLELPDPLVRTIEATAAAEDLTPEQFVEKLVERHLQERAWDEVIAKGKRQSQHLGYTEKDVDRLIHEHRAKKREHSL